MHDQDGHALRRAGKAIGEHRQAAAAWPFATSSVCDGGMTGAFKNPVTVRRVRQMRDPATSLFSACACIGAGRSSTFVYKARRAACVRPPALQRRRFPCVPAAKYARRLTRSQHAAHARATAGSQRRAAERFAKAMPGTVVPGPAAGSSTERQVRRLPAFSGAKFIHTAAENIPLITKKGRAYTWLFDLRRVFMQRQALEQIAHAFWERNAARAPFQLGGLETAAIPLLTALLLTAPKQRGAVNGFIIRKDRKTTGLGNAIEGAVLDLPIVLVEDSLNSGNSAEKARALVSMAGHPLDEVFVVVDFLSKAGMQWRKTHGIAVQSLFTLKDFDLPPDHSTQHPTQGYRKLWRTATPGGFAYHVVPKSAPLLVGNTLLHSCDAAKMQAFSAETGGLVWEYQVTGAAYTRKGIWSCPAYHDGRLYFGA
ncbi:hypothetical protein [Xanthomonas translucens]|uniref:hypothetical protein n=1 Tax=Xanthomonas campestris pv. translucens TaxID=343 RepID=UPI001F03DC6D|nr:hypothetical protein [Xanthomonas translucens]